MLKHPRRTGASARLRLATRVGCAPAELRADPFSSYAAATARPSRSLAAEGEGGAARSSAGALGAAAARRSRVLASTSAEDCSSTAPPSPGAVRQLAVRLGFRFVHGLREDTARRIETARAERPFAHTADLAQRAALGREELAKLAELGALASLPDAAASRRAALWQVAGIERDSRSLFAGTPPPDGDAPLPAMSPLEETLADYRASGLTTGPHVMTHLRDTLRRRGLLSAAALRDVPDGRWARTAGHVIVRQRPGSAKGMCFLTLEDETGTANAVLTPQLFRRFRVPLHTASLLEIAGPGAERGRRRAPTRPGAAPALARRRRAAREALGRVRARRPASGFTRLPLRANR